MMHDKAMRTFGALSLGLICGVSAACAGSDTPPTDDELRDSIAAAYVGGTARAGAGGAGSGQQEPDDAEGGSTGGTASASPAGAGGSAMVSTGSGGGVSAGGAPPAGEPEDPPPAGGGACDGFAILEARCNGPSCHGAGASFTNFAESEDVAVSFAGEPSLANCSGEGPLLDPANPPASTLVQKVRGIAPCGGPMPLGGAALSDEDIECLEDWIGSL